MPPDEHRPVAVLVGPMGAGKTTVGRVLSARLRQPLRDTDHDIESAVGKPISELFVDEGEAHFRSLERGAVATALAEHDGVLALGGGAVLAPETRELLRGHRVVFLNLSMPVGIKRTGLATNRPLLTGVNPRATYKALLDRRLPLYREVAMLEVQTDELSPEQVVDVIVTGLELT